MSGTDPAPLSFDDLVGAALLGTARRPVDPAGLPGAVGASAAGLPGGDPAALLLDAAALAVVHERAGVLPLRGQQPAPAAGEEAGRVAGPAAADRLGGLLARAGTQDGDALLALWLDAAAAAGVLAPPVLLPDLLEVATRSRATAARVAAVAGERGRWLAQWRPTWAGALSRHTPLGTSSGTAAPAPRQPGDPAQDPAWAHGAPAGRRAWLAALRATDPAAAREVLATSWASERGEDREALLPLLRDGLGPDDEPLLEVALRDRRAAVREVAAALLAALPGSVHGRRSAELALRHVRVERRRLRRTLVVTLPDLDPGEARALGVPPAPHGTGARQWQLQHLVAAAPLAVWEDTLGGNAEDLVALPVADDLYAVLHAGWAEAARTQQDAAWARALLAAGTTRDLAALALVLPPQERATVAAAALDADDGRDRRSRLPPSAELLRVLSGVPAPWPEPLAPSVVTWVRRVRRAAVWYDRPVVHLAGLRLPCDESTEAALRAAAAALPDDAPLAPDVSGAADTLSFRRHMLEELR